MTFQLIKPTIEQGSKVYTCEDITIEIKKKIVDGRYENKSPFQLRDENFLDLGVTKWALAKVKEIEQTVQAVMREQVVEIEEERNEDGEVTKEVVYNTRPVDIMELKMYTKTFFDTCDQETFDYVIDKYVEVNTGREAFSSYFVNDAKNI